MTKKDIIIELDTITKDWRYSKKLFRGGCAYATAILARTLKKAGIPYDVIVLDCWENNAVENNDSCVHMAIRPKYGRMHRLLGGTFHHDLADVQTNLGEVDPDTLLKYYHTVQKDSGWNSSYDINCNSTFSRLCNNVIKKYV